MSAVALVIAALGGGAVGWWWARRPGAGTWAAAAVGPHLLPEPALDWLRRAHDALGVWVAELDPEDEGPRAERIVDAERLGVAQIVAVDRRLERARDSEESGTERLDSGILVFCAAAGTAVGLLLPTDADTDKTVRAEDDVRRLLDGVRRRPQVVAQAQARSQDASFESVASVGLRLAYQVERILAERGLGAEVAVVAAEPTGVRVVGVSGRADRRLLDSVVPADSELVRVACGAPEAEGTDAAVAGIAIGPDPFGCVVADRRQREATALAFAMRVETRSVGAVVVWLASDAALVPAAGTELREALANAAPRLARALQAERERDGRRDGVDSLTGLHNRHGFEELLGRPDVRPGAVILIDLDRFKLLNDTLGQTAGDAVLVHIARLLREQIRAGDVAARVGGEEFAIWLPGADLELGAKVAERVRIRIGTTPWDWQGRAWPLSASFGVVQHAGTSQDVQTILVQATAALQVAKRGGRNRVEKVTPSY